jgi:hypothetical protein
MASLPGVLAGAATTAGGLPCISRSIARDELLAQLVELCSPGLLVSRVDALTAFGLSAGVLAAGPAKSLYSFERFGVGREERAYARDRRWGVQPEPVVRP